MNELEDKIKRWISKNGYPLEMEVAQTLKKNGFKVGQSILYKDPETNKYREIDIIAHSNKQINGVWFNLAYVVECKKSIDKPWVVLKNKELFSLKSERYRNFGTKNSEVLISEIKKTLKNKENIELIFPEIENAGYNILTAFKDTKDLAYNATNSLLNACNYLVNKSNKTGLKFCNIYIPIIIIEGYLYEYFLEQNGEFSLVKVNHSSVVNTKSFDETSSSLITVASSFDLVKFVKKLKKNSDVFFEKFEVQMKDISKKHPTSINLP
jgi:hypothetical protein